MEPNDEHPNNNGAAGNVVWQTNYHDPVEQQQIVLIRLLTYDAPELLFRCVEQGQEVAIIVDTPFTGVQLISTTILLLLKSGIFPMCEFEDWEAVQNKMWLLLNTFVHSAYACKLVANNLRNMTGQLGYVQPTHNMYNVLETVQLSNDATIIMQMVAAATTGSTLGSRYQTATSPVPHELTTAIITLAANQQLLFQHIALLTQHMAAMSLLSQQLMQLRQLAFHAPPVQHLTIPGPAPFACNGGGYTQGYNQRRSGRSNGQCRNQCGNNRGS
jgi:hypothetical protein